MKIFKTTVSTLVVAVLPAFALAAGDHGAHGAQGSKPEATAAATGHDMAGTVSYACLVPGHKEAGMVGTVEIQ